MTPNWVLAIVFFISAFLGMGQGSARYCGDGRTSQCVAPELCGPQRQATYRRIECPEVQVCCQVDQINNLSTYELEEFN